MPRSISRGAKTARAVSFVLSIKSDVWIESCRSEKSIAGEPLPRHVPKLDHSGRPGYVVYPRGAGRNHAAL